MKEDSYFFIQTMRQSPLDRTTRRGFGGLRAGPRVGEAQAWSGSLVTPGSNRDPVPNLSWGLSHVFYPTALFLKLQGTCQASCIKTVCSILFYFWSVSVLVPESLKSPDVWSKAVHSYSWPRMIGSSLWEPSHNSQPTCSSIHEPGCGGGICAAHRCLFFSFSFCLALLFLIPLPVEWKPTWFRNHSAPSQLGQLLNGAGVYNRLCWAARRERSVGGMPETCLAHSRCSLSPLAFFQNQGSLWNNSLFLVPDGLCVIG